jgi:hypothetical protein
MDALQPIPLQKHTFFAWSWVGGNFIANGCISCVWGYMCLCLCLFFLPMIQCVTATYTTMVLFNLVFVFVFVLVLFANDSLVLCFRLNSINHCVESIMWPWTKCIHVWVDVVPVITVCHNARQGFVHRPSPMCKHIACKMDLVCGQSRCLLCEPKYEALWSVCFFTNDYNVSQCKAKSVHKPGTLCKLITCTLD